MHEEVIAWILAGIIAGGIIWTIRSKYREWREWSQHDDLDEYAAFVDDEDEDDHHEP